eukprot:gene10622-14264_t
MNLEIADEITSIYKWENNINATWETVQEDADGNIIADSLHSIQSEAYKSHKAKRNRVTQSIRRGLIRYLIVAIDASSSAAGTDYRPCRLEASKSCLKQFILEYFDQNPISQLGLMITRSKTAERITDLSGNPKHHIHKLDSIKQTDGLSSLQNTILLAMASLRHIPTYGHRELLIVFSSLSSCDPGDIFSTIKEAIVAKVRISIICLLAEIFICKQIAELTGGLFSVALDATHLSQLLIAHTIPPPEIQKQETLTTDFIYMGFPRRVFDNHPSYCFDGKRMRLSSTGYICPRCHTRTTDIPTQCSVCTIQLNSSSHIARSYHHLFPIPNFIEFVVRFATVASGGPGDSNGSVYEAVDIGGNTIPLGATSHCYGCMDHVSIVDKLILKCPNCDKNFCIECDLYIHDSLHNCPGCG